MIEKNLEKLLWRADLETDSNIISSEIKDMEVVNYYSSIWLKMITRKVRVDKGQPITKVLTL